jgi:hypothetical protein
LGLKLNGTHQILAHADDLKLIDATKEVGSTVNVEKTNDMLLSCYWNADQNWDTEIANRSFQNVSHFNYFGMTVTNQN